MSANGKSKRSSVRACTHVSIGTACIVVAAALAGPAGAQSLDYAALEELFGEPVTTSVTGSPQRASDVPAATIIITAEDIRRSAARDIPGVLSRLAGLDVRRTTREHADVAVRGYNEAFTPRLLVLIDGRQVYADYYGFTPWSTLPIELGAIQQIEVVKGPNGALFGFNAVGGVVNIVTADPIRDIGEPVVSVSAGTHDLRQVSAVSTLHPGDRTGIRLSAGSRRTEEFSTTAGPVPGDIAIDRDNERNAVSLDAHVLLGRNSVLGFEATYSTADQFDLPASYRISRAEYEISSFRSHWEADTRLGLVKANVYKNDLAIDSYTGDSELPLEFDNDVLVTQLEDVFKVGASHVVRVAGEYRESKMSTTPITGGQVLYDILSLTAMNEWSVTPALSVTNAVRIDYWQLGREGFIPPAAVQSGVTNDAWDVTRDELSFNSGIVWHTAGTGTVRFSVGRARQLPNLFTLGGLLRNVFLDTYIVGTPGIEPSNVTNVEAGWTHTLERSGVALDLNAFRGDTEDVQTVLLGNIGASETAGLEVTAGGRIGNRWRWDVSLLEQRIDDELSPGIPFARSYVDFENTVAEHTLKGHIGWAHRRFEIDGYLRYTSDSAGLRVTDPVLLEASLVPVPSHVALDAQLGYMLGEHLRLSLTGRNLTRSSQRQTSALEVERQIFATVEYAF